MNKTIRNLAIAALFIFPGLSGFPQEVQQAAAPAAPVPSSARRRSSTSSDGAAPNVGRGANNGFRFRRPCNLPATYLMVGCRFWYNLRRDDRGAEG